MSSRLQALRQVQAHGGIPAQAEVGLPVRISKACGRQRQQASTARLTRGEGRLTVSVLCWSRRFLKGSRFAGSASRGGRWRIRPALGPACGELRTSRSNRGVEAQVAVMAEGRIRATQSSRAAGGAARVAITPSSRPDRKRYSRRGFPGRWPQRATGPSPPPALHQTGQLIHQKRVASGAVPARPARRRTAACASAGNGTTTGLPSGGAARGATARSAARPASASDRPRGPRSLRPPARASRVHHRLPATGVRRG